MDIKFCFLSRLVSSFSVGFWRRKKRNLEQILVIITRMIIGTLLLKSQSHVCAKIRTIDEPADEPEGIVFYAVICYDAVNSTKY